MIHKGEAQGLGLGPTPSRRLGGGKGVVKIQKPHLSATVSHQTSPKKEKDL